MSKISFGFEKWIPLGHIDLLKGQLEDLRLEENQVEDFDELAGKLLEEKIQVGLFPLSKIPIKMTKNLVIGALTKREDPSEILLLKKEKSENDKLLNLGEGATVSVFSDLQKAQLQVFREDLNFTKIEKISGDIDTDAILLPTWQASHFGEDYLKMPIQPEELIPTPGQGAFGYVCLDSNIRMRKILKQIHQPKTAAETNIERRIQRDLNHPVAVFCTKNNLNHFHVYATALRDEQLYHFSHSSTISNDLVKKVVEELGG